MVPSREIASSAPTRAPPASGTRSTTASGNSTSKRKSRGRRGPSSRVARLVSSSSNRMAVAPTSARRRAIRASSSRLAARGNTHADTTTVPLSGATSIASIPPGMVTSDLISSLPGRTTQMSTASPSAGLGAATTRVPSCRKAAATRSSRMGVTGRAGVEPSVFVSHSDRLNRVASLVSTSRSRRRPSGETSRSRTLGMSLMVARVSFTGCFLGVRAAVGWTGSRSSAGAGAH